MSMVPRLRALHQHVIHINFHVPSNLGLEHFIHRPLVCCPCVLQTERHNFVAVEALIDYERSLLSIFWVHEDLVVARKHIHETEQLVLEVESTSASMRGRGKLSFGQALLRSVKSIHILHFPLDFFTMTTFSNQSG